MTRGKRSRSKRPRSRGKKTDSDLYQRSVGEYRPVCMCKLELGNCEVHPTMSLDLDEIDTQILKDEISLREKLSARGFCDYCGRKLGSPTCKFPKRHNVDSEVRS